MENDLISRSGLGVDFCNPDVFENKAYAEGWNSLIKIIKEAPAVDAEPVRHGRWVQSTKEDEDWGGFFYRYTCTVCGWHCGSNPNGLYVFCPGCGCEMDAEVEGC